MTPKLHVDAGVLSSVMYVFSLQLQRGSFGFF